MDQLGSTRALSNSTGAVTDLYTYDAYGNLIVPMGPTANEFLYSGQQFDRATGQYYMRARYYDSAGGRFISRDSYEGSTSDPISHNRYAYADANPVDIADPSGHFGLGDVMPAIGIALNLVGRIGLAGAQIALRGVSAFRALLQAHPYLSGTTATALIGWAFSGMLRAQRGGYTMLTVPVTVVRVKNPNGITQSPSEASILASIQKASTFWEQYGIKIRVARVVEVQSAQYYDMSSDDAGRGEVETAVDDFRAQFGGKSVLIFNGYLSDQQGLRRGDSPAVTAHDREGFVSTEANWTVVAHELGHMFIGTYHEFYPDNILKQGLSEDPNREITSIWMSPFQVRNARSYITDHGLAD